VPQVALGEAPKALSPYQRPPLLESVARKIAEVIGQQLIFAELLAKIQEKEGLNDQVCRRQHFHLHFH
jgi:hypothetical protein